MAGSYVLVIGDNIPRIEMQLDDTIHKRVMMRKSLIALFLLVVVLFVATGVGAAEVGCQSIGTQCSCGGWDCWYVP